jgi:hypothetical protein
MLPLLLIHPGVSWREPSCSFWILSASVVREMQRFTVTLAQTPSDTLQNFAQQALQTARVCVKVR